jgi:hypothetical protein
MVNTIHDEDGIFVHPDGRSIYFSSRGHTSMGGYDIFRSRLENGQWTKPENLGWPINSADDDLFFVLTADGSTGYFSSLRPDGAGEDDIYVVDFLAGTSGATDDRTVGAAKAVVPAPEGAGTVLLKGRVKDLALLGQMEATIELMDLQDATVVARFTSDPTTGEYMIVVPAGRDYAMHVKADGYLLHSEYIHVPTGQRGLDLAVDIGMEPLSNGSRMELRNERLSRHPHLPSGDGVPLGEGHQPAGQPARGGHHGALEVSFGEPVDDHLVTVDRLGDHLVGAAAGAQVPEPLVGGLHRGRLVEHAPLHGPVRRQWGGRLLAVGIRVVGRELPKGRRGDKQPGGHDHERR